MSYKEFADWPIVKKYLACHYFLSEEKPSVITESQRAQLGALHLYVTHGPCGENTDLTEFARCTLAEKRRRISEWRKVENLSRTAAMQQFVAFVSSLFPSWSRYKRLYTEFEEEWTRMPPPPPEPKRVVRPTRWSHRKPQRPVLAERIERFHSQHCRLPALHARRDASDLVHATLRKGRWRRHESQYYRQRPGFSMMSTTRLSQTSAPEKEQPLSSSLHNTLRRGLNQVHAALDLLEQDFENAPDNTS